MKLTKDSLAALTAPAGKADHIEWDDDLPGFGIRLRGGTKRWIVQYRIGSQQRRESLGDVRKVALDDARKAARQRFAKVELGIDPGAEADAASAKITMGAVADRYLAAKEGVRRFNTYRAARLHFSTHWKPLRGLALDALTRAQIASRLQEITTAHGRRIGKLADALPVLQVVTQRLDCAGDSLLRSADECPPKPKPERQRTTSFSIL